MQSVEATNTTGTHTMYTRRSTALCYFGTINPFPLPPFFLSEMSSVTLCDVNGYFVLITGIQSPDRIYLQLSTLSYNKLMDDSSFSPLQLKSHKGRQRQNDSTWKAGRGNCKDLALCLEHFRI